MTTPVIVPVNPVVVPVNATEPSTVPIVIGSPVAEVFVGPDQPAGASVELWYDTDTPGVLRAKVAPDQWEDVTSVGPQGPPGPPGPGGAGVVVSDTPPSNPTVGTIWVKP